MDSAVGFCGDAAEAIDISAVYGNAGIYGDIGFADKMPVVENAAFRIVSCEAVAVSLSVIARKQELPKVQESPVGSNIFRQRIAEADGSGMTVNDGKGIIQPGTAIEHGFTAADSAVIKAGTLQLPWRNLSFL